MKYAGHLSRSASFGAVVERQRCYCGQSSRQSDSGAGACTDRRLSEAGLISVCQVGLLPEQTSGQRTGVLVVTDNLGSRHKRVHVTIGALYQTLAAGGQVIHYLGLT